ncbi:hypothetical protein BC835DRAFT_1361741 [Cytidiella melzeri]|nr:hypothetical protein BC835DRAFT_1361741 [Cytidiella melzeri]
MPRAFHLPAVTLILAAFTLLFFVSLSLPFLPALDLVRVRFEGIATRGYGGQPSLLELRFGTWGYCWYESTGARFCNTPGHAYTTTVYNADKSRWQSLPPAFTRGLAVHPAAAGLTFVALLLSLFTNITVALLAAFVTFLAALLTLATLGLDIALYSGVKHRMGKLSGVSQHTEPGTGFWMVFASVALLFLAGCTVCFGRRRDRMAGATSYPLIHHNKSSYRSRFRL